MKRGPGSGAGAVEQGPGLGPRVEPLIRRHGTLRAESWEREPVATGKGPSRPSSSSVFPLPVAAWRLTVRNPFPRRHGRPVRRPAAAGPARSGPDSPACSS